MFLQRLVDAVWSFILTLVRSLFALFSFRRRSSDPFPLPTVSRAPKDALARAHTRLRPILLTPRSIAHHAQRAVSTRSGSPTSTLFPHHEQATASGSGADEPQRTSPKLGSSTTTAPAGDSAREGTPDTASLDTPPLTPPDRSFLSPIPSVTDCPYAEPWPTTVPLDRSKARLPGSPLNANPALTAPMVGPIGSPPPAHWSPSQSTPYKSDELVPDPVLSPFDQLTSSSALVNISHALVSRSRGSIKPYDDASSEASMLVNTSNAQVTRFNHQHFAQFHRPEAYVTWRRPSRLPGKLARATHPHVHTRSYSHADLSPSQWYDADAYVPSPVSALSPPHCDTATEDEDEDEMPLGHLRERLSHRGPCYSLAVPLDADICKAAAAMSPRTRRMSDGCLLAMSESTPTRVGFGTRSSRRVSSLAFDGDSYGYKDWLEALSLRFSSESKDLLTPAPEPCVDVPLDEAAT